MDRKDRRRHRNADGNWKVNAGDGDKLDTDQVQAILTMDLRAALHDMIDEVRETNRILRLAFGVGDKKGDEQ